MKKKIEFIVHPVRGDSFKVLKRISERSLRRVMMNLMRKHNAFEVERIV